MAQNQMPCVYIIKNISPYSGRREPHSAQNLPLFSEYPHAGQVHVPSSRTEYVKGTVTVPEETDGTAGPKEPMGFL